MFSDQLMPPVVDYGAAHNEYWPGMGNAGRTMRHVGIIISKTGHDRGQKEMYLYSPTVRRDGGKIVCSSDFLNFEVGEWILFNVVSNKIDLEVYMSGVKWLDPVLPTTLQFDCPKVKVRACIYPNAVYTHSSLVCRRGTHRCWSPDIGDIFIDSAMFRSHQQIVHKFVTEPNLMFHVEASYATVSASIFSEFDGPDNMRHVYWRVESVVREVSDPEDIAAFALVPWRGHVRRHVERHEAMGNFSHGVPPWYIRSVRVLTSDMIKTWEEETKMYYGTNNQADHPVPFKIENGVPVDVPLPALFTAMKDKKLEDETKTLINPCALTEKRMACTTSWKKVMSYDGTMLEPGSLMPPVSTSRKKGNLPGPLVQDSAGFFMNSAAAQSYVDIKQTGTRKMWATGGWKNPGEAWKTGGDVKPVKDVNKTACQVAELTARSDSTMSQNGSKNLLGTWKAPPSIGAVLGWGKAPERTACTTPTPSLPSVAVSPCGNSAKHSFASAAKNSTSAEKQHGSTEQQKVASFASAAKMSKEKEADGENGKVEAGFAHAAKMSNEKEDKSGAEVADAAKKYHDLMAFVADLEEHNKNEPDIRGFTCRQYIKAQQAKIKFFTRLLNLGLADKALADKEIDELYENIGYVEEKLENQELVESEMYEIHLTKEQDAENKKAVEEYIEMKKRQLAEMRENLDMQSERKSKEHPFTFSKKPYPNMTQ